MGRIEINELLIAMLKDARDEVNGFNRKSYSGRFDDLYEKHVTTLEAIEKCYEGDGEEAFADFAETLATYAYERIMELPKRKREIAITDYNLAMVTFFLPMVEMRREHFMSLFSNQCIEQWNKTFPRNKIQGASKGEIEGGFKNNLCYITTAVCENFHKQDDCYELELLRTYRDEYLINETIDGKAIVKKYYDIAPTIVNRINRCADSSKIYEEIWKMYLEPCIRFIEDGDREKSKELYISMVEELSNEFFH